MWCDNCLLVLPLRGGAIAWNAFIVVYSAAGMYFFIEYGSFFFFIKYEWDVYLAISGIIAGVALINAVALSNRSYIWTRVCKFLWPVVLFIAAIRAIIIIVELERNQDHVQWECENGGVQWSASASTANGTSTAFPSAFCSAGWSSMNTAWIVALILDIGCQIYAYFLCWRFSKRLEHYNEMVGPVNGGFYKA